MGKAGGFLEYPRKNCPAEEPVKRVGSCREFHKELDRKEREEQGARCMNCGVPFCQSVFGCPLRNLIPEWNEEVFSGNVRHGVARLLKTNNFPEFTGRVCPALCENACVCGIHNDPVTVRENELYMIEAAWKAGFLKPEEPVVRSGKKVAVVGSGPSGLAAADQLNRRGHLVTVYERDPLPGGLLMYGIPSMKLEKQIVLRRVEKMKAEGVTFFCKTGIGKDLPAEALRAEYDAIILCCGARQPRTLEAGKKEIVGVVQALSYLSDSTAALLSGSAPSVSAKDRKVLVVGNGDTASDCVATAIRQGAESVRQLVRKPPAVKEAVSWPHAGRFSRPDYATEEAEAVFGEDPRMYGTVITEFRTDKKNRLTGVVVTQEGEEKELPADLVIVAAGFSGAERETPEAFGLSLNERNRLGDEAFRTGDEKIFACGDMRRGPSLVVWAIAEGRACAKEVDEYLEGYSYL